MHDQVCYCQTHPLPIHFEWPLEPQVGQHGIKRRAPEYVVGTKIFEKTDEIIAKQRQNSIAVGKDPTQVARPEEQHVFHWNGDRRNTEENGTHAC